MDEGEEGNAGDMYGAYAVIFHFSFPRSSFPQIDSAVACFDLPPNTPSDKADFSHLPP